MRTDRMIVALAVLAGCARVATPPTAPEESAETIGRREATPGEARVFESIRLRAEAIRGHEVGASLRFEVADAPSLARALMSSDPSSERSNHVLDALRLRNGASGAIVDDYLRSELVGVYLPSERAIVMRADHVQRLSEPTNAAEYDRLLVLHEVVHAIQHATVMSDMTDDPGTTDCMFVNRSLWEGDATFAMTVAVANGLGADPMRVARNPRGLETMARSAIEAQSRRRTFERSSPMLRTTFMTPYFAGTTFIARRFAEGGWPAVDATFEDRPRSMEQILHPDLFETNHAPEDIEIPTIEALDQAGYELVVEDTFGELGLFAYFALTGRTEDARIASNGWGGDRIRVYRGPDGGLVSIWLTSWDSIRDAVEAADLAQSVVSVLPRDARRLHHVRRHFRFVVVVDGLEGPLRDAADHSLDSLKESGSRDVIRWSGGD